MSNIAPMWLSILRVVNRLYAMWRLPKLAGTSSLIGALKVVPDGGRQPVAAE